MRQWLSEGTEDICAISPGTAHLLGTGRGSGFSPPLLDAQEEVQDLSKRRAHKTYSSLSHFMLEHLQTD